MNCAEDSKYLGSCEDLCLMALCIGVYGERRGAHLYYTANLSSQMN